LNGPQTTGRHYVGLSEPTHSSTVDRNVAIDVRDGTTLMADVHRPSSAGRFPALLAVSCYPRQIQNSGAPLGFVEAGASDFWVPRGYAHVIANSRGTGGSTGTYSWLDRTERQDVADLVEWVASQPWCDGNVGMIGISYFAMTQLAAAIEAPKHLKAIFPVATTADVFEAVWHNGLLSSTFVTAWLAGVATLSDVPDSALRGKVATALSALLRRPRIHDTFAHLNGEAALSALGSVMRRHFPDDPWGQLWRDVTITHQTRDEWWEQRNLARLLDGCRVPMYLGCDWENVPLHLPSTFAVYDRVRATAPVRVGMLGAHGLSWPWESLHYEALAWFDHWLKGVDTGIMSGPAIRYHLPGAERFLAAAEWPPAASALTTWQLRADGTLGPPDQLGGDRSYLHLGTGLTPPRGAPTPPLASLLQWDSPPLERDLDVVGDAEVRLDASITASDTSWIVTVQDVAPDGAVTDVTAGWLRASLRTVAEDASRPGHPVIPAAVPVAVPPHEVIAYRIPLVSTARRFAAGHRVRLVVASDDTTAGHPAILGFRHEPVATPSLNTVRGSSHLLLPVLTAPSTTDR
jgi:putative CocE/NonD family hydrolase